MPITSLDYAYDQDVKNKAAIFPATELNKKIAGIRAQKEPALTKRNQVLALLRDALSEGRAEVRKRFDEKASGTMVVRANCFLVDQIVKLVYHFVNEELYPVGVPSKGESLSVAAVGGYGRGELAPQSDVDILFLLPYKKTPRTEQVVEAMLYFLWDLNFKIGHSVRTLKECIRSSQADLTINTSILESRFLCGDLKLFTQLRKTYDRVVRSGRGATFIEEKLAERSERHKKVGGSRYTLEPNIKEGKGGLRDLQTLFWIAKFIYQVDDVSSLVERGVFTRQEVRQFEKAQAFLWSVRCALHYLTNRPEERLSFDVQRELADWMQYTDHAGTKGVERMMKHYFIVAKAVGGLTRIFCAALEAEHNRRSGFRLPLPFLQRKRTVEKFRLEGDRLTFRQEDTLDKDPLEMLRIFHVAQKHDLDIHPAALRKITQNLRLIKHHLRDNEAASRLFLDILASPKDPEKTLRRLNESGVLGRFVPDFGRVEALMQFNMYHHYTVDEHTLFAVGILHQIEKGLLQKEAPIASEVVHKVLSRKVLYVAVFLHDIAKGRSGDHSIEGAKIALRICPRMGLTAEETETVSWLVRYHLTMSETAFSRDIDDPKTIQDFAEIVQSPERLRLLLILTVADIRAVGPNVWNAWKAALLRELYWRTEELLSGGLAAEGQERRVQVAWEKLTAALSHWPAQELALHLERGTVSYWISSDTETQARHAELIRQAEVDKSPFTAEVRVDHYRQVTEVTIYAADHPGLFSRVAGALAVSGASIEGATIHTLRNGMALDSFYIADSHSKTLIEDPDRLHQIETAIEQSLTGELKAAKLLKNLPTRLPSRVLKAMRVKPRVLIDNKASASYTVIEVNGQDRPGLLYHLTQALTKLGLLVHSARIATYGVRAVDVFYVESALGDKISSQQKLNTIQKKLLEILES
ncbi:[protein-PII] uridylyltransferase [Kiloniella laminariae]|uniref:Bifunctional uridylyltransferase/uridylyl-removing enzyme n=1 Tax=Kiloniella laminariae TaxID=454162 RepID=A0ABT4LJH9_9PROT|nr:[protein-PII] uridylyltransferase [Kiloniella laminariae]MCZ4281272.1 [protein-PII] uridylyltransferase [Kiloniella laminariae]